jgi:hypothetical protein
MEVTGIDWVDYAFETLRWLIIVVGAGLVGVWRQLVELQAQYPELLSIQTLFGLVGTTLGVWRWWEGREVNLFRRFESMIERQEARLVKARSDLVDVINRPGPGLVIRAPVFAEKSVRSILARRRWHTAFSLASLAQSIDRRLEHAIATCDRKVSAHLDRLSFFRQQIAAARLVQGALAAGRAARAGEEHERQLLDQEALDHFRSVLALPGHKEDVGALEFMAHQLRRLDGRGQSAIDAYRMVIDVLEPMPRTPSRNLVVARAKRCLAILRYPTTPGIAHDLLDEAIAVLIEFGPPRDRDLLELAETVHLDGIARLRLGHTVLGPQQLNLAQGHYRDLLRSLRIRRRGLFSWMSRERRFAGHRVAELRARAEQQLAKVNHLIELSDRYPRTLMANLARGSGVPRHNRKPSRSRQGH